MIEFIRIQRFKTLLDASFPLTFLNLFSGLNGMGKSSLVQILLLLRQSYESNALFNRGLRLKGDYVSLGTGQDVLSEQADVNELEFLIKWSDREPVTFSFNYDMQSDLQPIGSGLTVPTPGILSLFNRDFQYLSAERVPPRTSYEVSDYFIKDINSLGNHGEYTAHFIAEYGSTIKPLVILPSLKHPQAFSDSLLDSVNGWMAELSPGLRIHAKKQPELNSVSLGYAYENGREVTAVFKPQNVGFGLTYALPVITALLRSKPGDLLIIENPESHLHPAGQAVLGKMCAIAASSGVQLFIETHSDHFLNAVRVAVKEKVILHDSIKLFFLERDERSPSHASIVRSPAINEEGKIEYWPKGFFDEWDNQLEKLL